ncbi:hypothetical protein [Roseiconus lacunae]|uniref:Uncharacterized protein n=1 Tax=Roseiconus lacunae TaxID=2605694 RepID=A0ABT7PER1_9BACT|nr:hypothetical protein [Roseiconus lacunae]MDM4014980.1 hypothetical protein [Roseiconus lacunae]
MNPYKAPSETESASVAIPEGTGKAGGVGEMIFMIGFVCLFIIAISGLTWILAPTA